MRLTRGSQEETGLTVKGVKYVEVAKLTPAKASALKVVFTGGRAGFDLGAWCGPTTAEIDGCSARMGFSTAIPSERTVVVFYPERSTQSAAALFP